MGHSFFDIDTVEKAPCVNLGELMEQGNAARGSGRDGEVTPRLVRFLITEGILLAPTGGRKHATYPAENVDRLRVYQAMRRFNQPIGLIRQALEAGAFSVEIAPGFLLLADPSAGTGHIDPAMAAEAARQLAETVNRLRSNQEDPHDAA